MKHYLRFMLVLLLSTVWCVGGYSQEKTLSVDFESRLTTYTDWTFKNITQANKITANTGRYYGNTSGKTTAYIQTKNIIEAPGTLKFYISKESSNSKPSNWKIQVSPDATKWTNIKTQSAGSGITSGEWTEVSQDLSSQKNVYVRVYYDGRTAIRCIDDITLTYYDKTLTSLAISGTPNKKTYDDGDEFDPTGLVVTGTYDDNSTAAITNGITWTRTPATLAVGTTSCSVTATVNGVTSPAYNVTGLTVVKSIKPIVFDFTANPNVWGVTPLNINGTNGSNVIAGKKLVVERVVMTATNGNDNGTCIFKNNKGSVNLRVYIGGSITFTAPEGYNLSNITFDFDNTGTFSTDVQTWETPTWTGNAHTVTFTCKTSIQVNTATIKLVAATPVTPEVTSGTIEFKAVDNDLHYATFSSDKDVVFYKDLDVFGVSVAGGKISQNPLAKSIYNVTDATAGEDKDGAVEGYYVPANTGVLVVCLEKTAPYYFPKEEAQTVTLPALPANQLQPTPANGGVFTHEDGYKYYKLAYDNYTAKTGLGFYWGAENGGVFSVKAGTAYLAVPESEVNNAKGFAFDGETTGIENVNVAANQSKTIYNLNGQRVSNMSQAGLYIVNGKKVVIRK